MSVSTDPILSIGITSVSKNPFNPVFIMMGSFFLKEGILYSGSLR
jgi:hypothetical protein